jgi:integral membrane protein (TIGR01906 family)
MKFPRLAFSWLTAVLVPVALIFLGIRILLSSAFLILEYRMPSFPEDSYGFTLEERLKWSKLAVQYLVNDSGVEFLGNLTFPDGMALYNERELSHMLDVKKVVKPVLSIGYVTWILLAGFGFIASRLNWQAEYRKGLRYGGWIMIGLLSVIGIFAMISFWNFFTVFHSLFFEGDSWLFLYSDTLIRLFPLRFWQDAFLLVGIVALGGSLALVAGLKPMRKTSV